MTNFTNRTYQVGDTVAIACVIRDGRGHTIATYDDYRIRDTDTIGLVEAVVVAVQSYDSNSSQSNWIELRYDRNAMRSTGIGGSRESNLSVFLTQDQINSLPSRVSVACRHLSETQKTFVKEYLFPKVVVTHSYASFLRDMVRAVGGTVQPVFGVSEDLKAAAQAIGLGYYPLLRNSVVEGSWNPAITGQVQDDDNADEVEYEDEDEDA